MIGRPSEPDGGRGIHPQNIDPTIKGLTKARQIWMVEVGLVIGKVGSSKVRHKPRGRIVPLLRFIPVRCSALSHKQPRLINSSTGQRASACFSKLKDSTLHPCTRDQCPWNKSAHILQSIPSSTSLRVVNCCHIKLSSTRRRHSGNM